MAEEHADTHPPLRDRQDLVSIGDAAGRQKVAMMEDADAEAVLLSLANPLVWRNSRSASSCWAIVTSGKHYGVYNKSFVEGKDWLAETNGPEVTYERFLCNTRAEAITACERHYATGQWE